MDKKYYVTDPKKVSVSISVGIILIIVFLMYQTSILTTLPCDKNILDVFASIFTHVEWSHLLSNLFALYVLSRIEIQMESKSFTWLLVFLLAFNTVVEYTVKNIFDIRCSIGYSGILFGLMTWEILMEKSISIEVMLSIVVIVFGPGLNNKKISVEGHVIGAISGVIGALVYSRV